MLSPKVIKLGEFAVATPSALEALGTFLSQADNSSSVIFTSLATESLEQAKPANHLLEVLRSSGVAVFAFEPPSENELNSEDLNRAALQDQLRRAAESACGGPATAIIDASSIAESKGEYNSYIGRFSTLLEAAELQIWTDSHGFLSADTDFVPTGFTIPELSYEEALELGYTGIKALAPPLLAAAREGNLKVRIVSAIDPSGACTVVQRSGVHRDSAVTGLSSIAPVSLLRIEGAGIADSTGMAARVFQALRKIGVAVIFVSQTASEHSISLAVSSQHCQAAEEALRAAFQEEFHKQQIEQIKVKHECAIIAAVGEGMKGRPGVSGKLFHALGQNGVNIVAITQGSSERNVSVIVKREDEAKALNVLHDAFVLSPWKTANLFLVGTGQVGATLLEQIKAQQTRLAERRMQLRLVTLANSRKMLSTDQGIRLDEWRDVLEQDGSSTNLAKLVEKCIGLNLPNSIFVDCTASDAVAGVYQELLKHSISVVTPNKRAQSGETAQYQELKSLASHTGVKFYYETTVGAGLPIIGTLHDLLASGDQVIRIEAVLSGTLSYLFNSFTEGVRFSDIVREAREKGYTEPDPRDDLSGTDVARKLLILSREIQWAREMADIDVESLVPEQLQNCGSVEEFLSRLPETDEQFEQRRAAAAAQQQVLRYIGTITTSSAEVGLRAVGRGHPFFDLSGSDNVIAIFTQRYSERPLVVKGPGAGTEVTAAGVLADVLRVVSYLE